MNEANAALSLAGTLIEALDVPKFEDDALAGIGIGPFGQAVAGIPGLDGNRTLDREELGLAAEPQDANDWFERARKPNAAGLDTEDLARVLSGFTGPQRFELEQCIQALASAKDFVSNAGLTEFKLSMIYAELDALEARQLDPSFSASERTQLAHLRADVETFNLIAAARQSLTVALGQFASA